MFIYLFICIIAIKIFVFINVILGPILQFKVSIIIKITGKSILGIDKDELVIIYFSNIRKIQSRDL